MKVELKLNKVHLEVSIHEAVLLNNAIGLITGGPSPYVVDNEGEFHTLIGSTREEANAVLRQLGAAIDKLKDKYPDEYYGTGE